MPIASPRELFVHELSDIMSAEHIILGILPELAKEATHPELQKALRDLARETGANIVLDARQAKPAELPVTLRLTEVPLETAVRVLAESAGLRAVRMSNVLFVTSREVATEIRKEEETARQQELLELLQRLFGIPGGPAGGLVR